MRLWAVGLTGAIRNMFAGHLKAKAKATHSQLELVLHSTHTHTMRMHVCVCVLASVRNGAYGGGTHLVALNLLQLFVPHQVDQREGQQ